MSNFARMTLMLLCAVGYPALSTAQEKAPLKPWNLLGGRVSILAPSAMAMMSDSDKAEKYTAAEPPAYVLTNDDWTLNITFDLKKIPMKPEEVRANEEGMRKALSAGKINSSGVKKLNGLEFVMIDVDSEAEDATIHNLIAMTSLDDRMLLISYNCVLDSDPKCGEIGPRIIESIVIRPKPAAK